MEESYWKQRVESLETRLLEKSRACAHQHVALGKLMDIVEDAEVTYKEVEVWVLIRSLKEVLQPYQEHLKQFHMAEWALQESVRDGPLVKEVGG